jgi:serine phosphatase RsbU (regulator of sigma subunit)
LLGLLIALIVVAYVVYSLNQKKKTNKILNAQNEEITEQHFIIEEKNKDITDSLNYAQRIQDAILPEESLLNKSHEAFIYYRPKDIVSGDFYWMKEIGDKIYFSVVDCTGHGVSGAFMSIIGINSLNKIVDDFKIESTGKILDELNKSVNTALGVNHADENSIVNIRDGMDICICSIDKSTNNLEYSGANNSLYLIRNKENLIKERDCILDNDQSIFYEIKPDKMAIGGGSNKVKYKTHSIQLKKDDTLYLFSDGYADQFGGTKGKKFMYKPFKRMFLSIQDQSMDSQLSHIDKTMREWKMGIEQLDDICVMGVRV